jgi:hypothetical protein
MKNEFIGFLILIGSFFLETFLTLTAGSEGEENSEEPGEIITELIEVLRSFACLESSLSDHSP